MNTEDSTERGSVTLFFVLGAVVMILLVGLAVDLSGQLHAQQRARDIAVQAARVGGEEIQAGPAIRGEGAVSDPAAGVAAAQAYLAASEIQGTASLGADTVEVSTTAQYQTRFLSIIGLGSVTVTGHGSARIVRAAEGVEQ